MGNKPLLCASLRVSLLGGLALLAGPAFADQPATLTDALVDSYYNNPTLQEQRAALRQADEEVPAALSGWRPTVTLQGQVGRVSGVEKYATTGINPVTNLPVTQHTRVPENGTEKIGQLTLTQPIYNGGKTTSQTRQAKNDVYAARAQLLSQEQTVFYNVVQAYVSVVTDQKLLDLQDNNQQVMKRQLHDTQTQFNLGEITMTSVAQAQASLPQAEQQVKVAQRKAYADATQAWEGMTSSRSAVLATNAEIKANAIALDGTEREELVGTRTTLDVLNAQQALLTSQIQQVQNISQMVNYSYDVASAIGRLTARDLNLPVQEYDDEKYYDAVKFAGFGTGGGADQDAGITPDGAMVATSASASGQAVP